MAKKQKPLFEGQIRNRYVRVDRPEGPGIRVRVWKAAAPDGKPDGEFILIESLGIDVAIKEAVRRTP